MRVALLCRLHEEKLRKHEDKKAQKLLDEFTTRKFSTPKEDS